MTARQLISMAVILGLTALGADLAHAAPNCPALRWTTLGTAGGPVPTADRAEPSNLLVAGDQHILVDAGDGTVNQLARLGQDMRRIRTVFISHLHLDHSGGLGAVIGLRWMNQFPGQMTIYGPPGTQQVVDGIVASMAPPARIGFGLGALPPTPAGSVRVIELRDGQAIDLGEGVAVRAVANSHFDHDGAPDPDTVSLSYRFTLGDRSITYTGDTGPSAAVTKLASGSDMLVSEVIDLDRLLAEIRQRRVDASPEMLASMKQHLSTHHLLAADIGLMASQAKVGRVVLTHFAVPGLLSESEPTLRGDIGKNYAGPLDLARDLSSFDVGCR
ncbi:MBL fold metallo-hydrolase [Sphingobium sp. C100]|uniref:MBL fold metallo-hydrolase n=1 Tax=Sphingobium sp. C100 TaxID=1207055 RepID=UPI001F396F7C|nr:MBL fold metallo-hydrolase [Sphingobium sp. C100]